MSDLLSRIRSAQILAGEQAVIDDLREQGLLPPEVESNERTIKITKEELEFIIDRLLSYSRHESKKLINAQKKNLNPILVKNMNVSMTEAMRIATKLQETKA